MRLLRLSCLLLALITIAGPAHADDKSAARDLYREAMRLYDVGEYRQSLEDFKKAYLRFEEPAFLFNMAQCYRQIGDKAEAVRTYRSYLRKVPDLPNRDQIERLISSLETAIHEDQQRASEAGAKSPKQPTTQPTPTTGTSQPAPAPPKSIDLRVQSASSAPVHARKPIYRRWWLWTGLGVIAAGVGVGLGVGLAPRTLNASTSLGTYGF
jgi:tetratricopeptide (TPR) repeat protein